jgi:transposase InsO family protein
MAVQIRLKLGDQGCYDGPWSVLAEWPDTGPPKPSESTLSRLFRARGLVVPQPQKRPRSAVRRYQREKPNELWCSDGFEWRLADGTTACVLQLLDDCSRFDLGSIAAVSENSADIQAMLTAAIECFGLPQQFLSDNSSAFNPHRRGHHGGIARWLQNQGVTTITCSVNHPKGNGKSERAHQTMQKWLAARPRARTLAQLQSQIDGYRDYYNHRPHQSLGGATPQQVWDELPHAAPPVVGEHPDTILIRPIKVAANGNVAVRPYGTIQVGKRHAGEHCHVLIRPHEATITVFDTIGTEIRTVTLNPDQTYYGLRTKS